MKCSDGLQCFHKWFKCNGENDCLDGSDEISTTCKGLFCNCFVCDQRPLKYDLIHFGGEGYQKTMGGGCMTVYYIVFKDRFSTKFSDFFPDPFSRRQKDQQGMRNWVWGKL